MNLRQIELFRAIMNTGSFTAAAKLMHISQPGISRAARHLEIQLGVPLFELKHRRIQPTSEARALHREIERSYRGVQSIQEFAQGLKTGAQSVLRVVTSANTGLQLVPDAIATLSRSHADTMFSLEVLRGPLLVEALLQEHADLGFSAVPLEHPLLESRPVGRWTMVCVFPKGHPLHRKRTFAVRDALPYPLVTFTPDLPQGRTVEEWLKGTSPRRSVQVRSGLAACALVRSGAGITFCDDLTARTFESQGLAWRPVPNSPAFATVAVWNSGIPLSRLAGALCDAVQERFKALPTAIS